jgi:hypothetical protein
MSWVLLAQLTERALVSFGPYDDEEEALQFAADHLTMVDEDLPLTDNDPSELLPCRDMTVMACITTVEEARAYLLYVAAIPDVPE